MRGDSYPFHALEPDQFAAARAHPFARRELSRPTMILLGLLRIYVLVAVPVVCYAFTHALMTQ